MGDLRPLIALALALRLRGFEIVVQGDPALEWSAHQAGIAPSEWLSSASVSQAVLVRTEAGQRAISGMRVRYRDRWMSRQSNRNEKEQSDRLRRRLGGWDNPRIVAVIGSIPAYPLLGRFGRQCARVISTAMPYQSSKDFTMRPPDASPLWRLRKWRRGFWHFARQRQFRECTFHLLHASPTIFPRPTDWLPNMQVTGYVTLDDETGWTPPPRLTDFLNHGSPPVFAGFGTHPMLFGAAGESRARQILEACRRLAVRCVLQSPDLPSWQPSKDVFILHEHVPHAWLFPRCVAVVHHGGYGTVHAALVARKPMVVYPFQTDQFLWAARMGTLGVGPGFTARLKNLSTARLEADLTFVLRAECRDKAERLGQAVAGEQGLPIQVAAIESIIEHTRRGLRPVDWQMPVLNVAEPRGHAAMS